MELFVFVYCFCLPFVIYNLHREKAASHNFSCMCHKMAALENDNYGFFFLIFYTDVLYKYYLR